MTDRDRHPQQTFKGVRVTFTATQSCSAPPEKVFPLLCPIREYEYIPAWECDVVYLGSGFAENGGVFTTKLPGDGEGKDLLKRDALKILSFQSDKKGISANACQD